MRVFKIREFEKECRRLGVDETMIGKALDQVLAGKIDAFLGGEVIKQRVARTGQGKSGGFRTFLLFRANHRCVFMHVFAKNEKENVGEHALREYRQAAKLFLGFDDSVVNKMVSSNAWIEMK
jgi:hypothetical protein